MASFKEIVHYGEEKLLQLLHEFHNSKLVNEDKAESIAAKLELHEAQLVCAIGFNENLKNIEEIPLILGFENYNALVIYRNEIFTTDTYRQLTLDNILSIYATIKNDVQNKQIVEYLLFSRLESIEKIIEETVNPLIIIKYKKEMRAIYTNNIVSVDFIESRLSQPNNGFRALLNEVSLIVENKLMPPEDIFFRNTILSQEKRKLLDKGLIPQKLVEMRLDDPGIAAAEKKIIYNYIKIKS